MEIVTDLNETYRRPLFPIKPQPVNLQECQKHYKTTWPGRPKQSSLQCPCCSSPYIKKAIPFCFSHSDLGYLGCGLPLYYHFIALCLTLSAICTVMTSLPSLILNLQSNSCQLQTSTLHCSPTIFLRLSVANKLGAYPLLQLQSYLINGNILVAMLVIQVFRKKMRDLQVEVGLQPEPSDYAVMVRISEQDKYFREADVRRALAEWFARRGQNEKDKGLWKCKDEFAVHKVVISYDLTTFRELEKELQELTQQIKNSAPSPGGSNIARKISRIETINELISNKSFARNAKCIIIFRYPQQRRFILNHYQKWFGLCVDPLTINGKPTQVSRVPMPGQILWQNHHFKKDKKLWMRIGMGFLTLLCIVVGEAIVFVILYIWFRYVRTGTSSDSYLSPLISLLISLINSLLYHLLSKLTTYQYRPTTLQQMVSIVRKVTLSVFLNSGVMLLFAYFILDLSSIWVYDGFVDTISYSFLFSTVLPQLYKYCNWGMLKGYYRRWRLRKGNIPEGMTQAQANQVFERTYDKIHEQYSWALHQMWWSALFSPLVPIAYPCVLISLTFQYLTQKLNFLYVFRQPKPFGNYLNLSMLNMLQFSLLLMGMGNLILDVIINKLANTPIPPAVLATDMLGISIGLCVFLLPTEWLNKMASLLLCLQKQKMFLNAEYQVASSKFITTYEKEHPLYKYGERNKHQVIEENFEVEMETLTHELQVTLKRSNSKMRHPLQINTSHNSSEDETVMYTSNHYPNKINRQPVQKPTKALVPNLGLSTPKIPGLTPQPPKPQSDRVVDFKDLVDGLDERQKSMVLSKFRKSVKTINKK